MLQFLLAQMYNEKEPALYQISQLSLYLSFFSQVAPDLFSFAESVSGRHCPAVRKASPFPDLLSPEESGPHKRLLSPG